MTSRRRLKKEIDYVVSDLILDSISFTNLYQKPNDEDALKIVQETLVLRNKLRDQANHPEQRSKSETAKIIMTISLKPSSMVLMKATASWGNW